MSDITTTEIFAAVGAIVTAIATVVGGPWAVWTYIDGRNAKAREDARASREEERAALAAEKEAWKELAGFHKLTVDVLVAAVLVSTQANDIAIDEFQECYAKWHTLFGEKKGLLGTNGRKRATDIAKSLSVINIHHMRLKLPSLKAGVLMTKEELISLCGRISGDPTYFIH